MKKVNLFIAQGFTVHPQNNARVTAEV